MDVVWEILITTGTILGLLLILFALWGSYLIAFKPEKIEALSARMNTWVSTKEISKNLDKRIDTTDAIMKHRWWVGSIFLIGAIYTFKYLYVDFKMDVFLDLVIEPSSPNAKAVYDLIFSMIQWVFIVFSVIGIFGCLAIMTEPERFTKWNEKLDRWIATDKAFEKFDGTRQYVDSWIMKNHGTVGIFLFLGSCYLLISYFSWVIR